MAISARQGGASIALSNSSSCSGASFLYADMQHSSARQAAPTQCRIPRAPITPRQLNQAQQRNVVRQWMGLPPIESNWQRTSRQARQAARYAAQTAGQSLGQMASLAGAAWHGIRAFSCESLIAGLPSLHLGPPGAAAQAPDPIHATQPTPSSSALDPMMKRASPGWSLQDCFAAFEQWTQWHFVAQPGGIGTIEELLAACPTVECGDRANGSLQGITLVIESARHLSKLAMTLHAGGAKVFVSADAVDEFRTVDQYAGPPELDSCLDIWFANGYTTLGTVTPGDWIPAQGGSVVLLSSREFAGQLEAIRNATYPACDADALACEPAPLPVPAPTPAPAPIPAPGRIAAGVDDYQPSPGAGHVPQPATNEVFADGPAPGGKSGECVTIIGASLGAVAGVAMLANLGVLVYRKSCPDNTASHLNNVVAIPSQATNAGVPPSSAIATNGLALATSVPAQVQTHAPIHGASYPPAGQPGGD